jgi:hypothetical protein
MQDINSDEMFIDRFVEVPYNEISELLLSKSFENVGSSNSQFNELLASLRTNPLKDNNIDLYLLNEKSVILGYNEGKSLAEIIIVHDHKDKVLAVDSTFKESFKIVHLWNAIAIRNEYVKFVNSIHSLNYMVADEATSNGLPQGALNFFQSGFERLFLDKFKDFPNLMYGKKAFEYIKSIE